MSVLPIDNDLSFSSFLPEYEAIQICAPFFNTTGILFFNFARMFDDGTCYFISTQHDVMLHFYKNGHPLFAPVQDNLLKDKFYYLIPTTGAYQQAMHDVHQYFGLGSALDIFEAHHGYVDVCCFATSADNNTIYNYYLNNLNILENFAREFKSKVNSLLNKSSISRVELPEALQLNFNSTQIDLGIGGTKRSDIISFESSSSLDINIEENLPEFDVLAKKLYRGYGQSITKRESQCLFYLIRGKSARETGIALNLSQRTVEFYLDSLKDKLNCSKKSGIVEKVFNLLSLKYH